MDPVVPLQFTGSLDTLPCRCDLNEDALFLDADGVIEGNELLGLRVETLQEFGEMFMVFYLSLRSFLVEGEAGVYFGGNPARYNLQDLLAKLDELWRSRYAKLATNEGGGKRTGVQKAGVTKAARRILTRRSMAAFVCSSMLPPFFFPCSTASSIRRWY